jgi:hypothetical protein
MSRPRRRAKTLPATRFNWADDLARIPGNKDAAIEISTVWKTVATTRTRQGMSDSTILCTRSRGGVRVVRYVATPSRCLCCSMRRTAGVGRSRSVQITSPPRRALQSTPRRCGKMGIHNRCTRTLVCVLTRRDRLRSCRLLTPVCSRKPVLSRCGKS